MTKEEKEELKMKQDKKLDDQMENYWGKTGLNNKRKLEKINQIINWMIIGKKMEEKRKKRKKKKKKKKKKKRKKKKKKKLNKNNCSFPKKTLLI